MRTETATYETTREMDREHERWFSSLPKDQPMPLQEVFRILCEIRENHRLMMEELRHNDEDAVYIEGELRDMAKSLVFFERLRPFIVQEIERIYRVIEEHFQQEPRAFYVKMDLGSFVDLDHVSYVLLQKGEQYKRIQYTSSDPVRHYANSFPSELLGQDPESIKKKLRRW